MANIPSNKMRNIHTNLGLNIKGANLALRHSAHH